MKKKIIILPFVGAKFDIGAVEGNSCIYFKRSGV